MTLNTQLLEDVAFQIDRDPGAFDLADFYWVPESASCDGTVDPNVCGTTMCIAGWVNWLTRDLTVPFTAAHAADVPHARKALGLSHEEGHDLFYADYASSVWVREASRYGWETDQFVGSEDPDTSLREWSEISGTQAAEVLRKIADGSIRL